MNKLNSFLALTAPFQLNLLSNLFITFETKFEPILLTNPGETFVSAFLPNNL